MTLKAAFYILTQTTLKARDLYTCRLIEKAYAQERKIYIHTASLPEAQNFATQLWTFRDISFVPHEIYSQNSMPETPVLIGYNDAPPENKDILINLTAVIPPLYNQFVHIITVIPNDDQWKIPARQQYQTYKQQGYAMETFNV